MQGGIGMKPGWKVERLGNLCDLITKGTTPTTLGFSFVDSGVNFVKIESLDSDGNFITDKMAHVTPECHNSFRRSQLQENDILFSIAGALGRVGLVTKDILPANTNQALAIIRLSNFDNTLPPYIIHCLKSQTVFEQINKFKAGVAQLNLSLEQIRELQIPIPTLPEQERIVAVLDEVFASIAQAKANTERNLVNARELFESVLQSSMSNDDWEKKTLKEISITFGRGKSKNRPRNDPKLYGGKYPFIQTGDIRNSNHYITEYSQTYSELGLAQSKLWPKGTICITIAANIAETGILGFDSCFPDSVIGLVVNPKIADVDFIEYLLQYFKKKLQAKGKGSAQDNLNMEKFENEYFPIPPLAEQRAIVGRLEALSAETGRLEAVYRQKVAALEALKKSVLAKAFEGEL
jgi:type I restriction enzyme, S subunit